MLLLILLSLHFPQLSHAQMGNLFGLGPRSSGMGAVSVIHDAPSAFQVLQAPAGLGYLRKVEVSVGGLYFDPRIEPFGTMAINSSGTVGEFRSSGVLPGSASTLALAFPLGKVRPITVGAAIFMPFSSLIRVSGSPVNYPFYPLYTDISRNFFFVLGLGWEVFPKISLGLNFRSTTKSNTYYTLRSDNSVNYSATATEAKGKNRVSVSALYQNDRGGEGAPFTIGAMYRAKAGLETRLAADVTAFVPVQGELISQPTYSPAEWVLMGSARIFETIKLSLDAAWVKWSDYSSPYGSGNINTYVIGANNAPANFKDIPVGRIGMEWEIARSGSLQKLLPRWGYMYHPSPVPDQNLNSNFADNDRHNLTAGLGMVFNSSWTEDGKVDIDLFTQFNWLKPRNVKKLSPTYVGAPGYGTSGKILLYGAGLTLRF